MPIFKALLEDLLTAGCLMSVSVKVWKCDDECRLILRDNI